MRHYIIVKFKKEISANQKKEMLQPIKSLFEQLYTIEGIHHIDVCPNIIDRENRYDLMIEIDMDKETLPVYDESETHKKWKSQYGSFIESKTIFDR